MSHTGQGLCVSCVSGLGCSGGVLSIPGNFNNQKEEENKIIYGGVEGFLLWVCVVGEFFFFNYFFWDA